jgi:hypothetical protein
MPAPTTATSRTPRASTLSPRQRLRRRVLLGAILTLEVVVLGYAGASVLAAKAAVGLADHDRRVPTGVQTAAMLR